MPGSRVPSMLRFGPLRTRTRLAMISALCTGRFGRRKRGYTNCTEKAKLTPPQKGGVSSSGTFLALLAGAFLAAVFAAGFLAAAFFLAGAFLTLVPVASARAASRATACSSVTSSGLLSLGMVALILPWFT